MPKRKNMKGMTLNFEESLPDELFFPNLLAWENEGHYLFLLAKRFRKLVNRIDRLGGRAVTRSSREREV